MGFTLREATLPGIALRGRTLRVVSLRGVTLRGVALRGVALSVALRGVALSRVAPRVTVALVGVATGHLALVAARETAIVEVLGRGRLVPLGVGLLATAVATSARRAVVAHRLGAIAGRRLGLGTAVTGLLTRAIGTCVTVKRPISE